jgi:hypothetical protein
MGFLPVATDDSLAAIIVSVLITLAICAVALLKGKIVLGAVGMLLPIVGLVGAIRLAKPDSPWALRRYRPGSSKLARAEKRFRRHSRRYQRFQDRIAGAPGAPE